MIALEFAGRRMSMAAWGRELGLSGDTIRKRMVRGLPLDLVLMPGRAPNHGRRRSASTALEARAKTVMETASALFDDPWEALLAAMICRAVVDWTDPLQREDVEDFFQGGWFAALTGMDGAEIVREIRAAA